MILLHKFIALREKVGFDDHAVASSNEEMERWIYNTLDKLPGVLECSSNVILSRIKDIKGLRL